MAVAVILSGGVGARMNLDKYPKQYIRVAGRMIIEFALDSFVRARGVYSIVVVAAPLYRPSLSQYFERTAEEIVFAFANPGDSRQESMLNGLKIAAQIPNDDDVVIIHDAARPNITSDEIDSYIAALEGYDGVMPSLPMKDTIYLSNGDSIDGLLDRSMLFAGQAPEVFRLSSYLAITEAASLEELASTRGTSEMAFRHGMAVRIVSGSESNYKITTREDLRRFCNQVGFNYEQCIADVLTSVPEE